MKKHTNIVMDPITHLLQVDKIVDDISKEIVHRPRHSPHKDQWVESNNVAVMEGFGKRTISLSKSTRDLNLTNENEELEVINDHSDWKIKSRAIKRRSRGWMNRLQEECNPRPITKVVVSSLVQAPCGFYIWHQSSLKLSVKRDR
jgi:hypothetical protein